MKVSKEKEHAEQRPGKRNPRRFHERFADQLEAHQDTQLDQHVTSFLVLEVHSIVADQCGRGVQGKLCELSKEAWRSSGGSCDSETRTSAVMITAVHATSRKAKQCGR